ncbi:unnamed protein product [Amoebophrya sp. A120]|nr:unnamed protein product [Amoebophrya sp. A120]|eukprot:GSA120T00003028001.1
MSMVSAGGGSSSSSDQDVVREITTLHRHLEGRMEELRRMFARGGNQPQASTPEMRSYQGATESCLRDFERHLERLSALWAGDSRTTTQMKLRRFREQYRDLVQDFKSLTRDLPAQIGKSNLLPVRERDVYAKNEEEGLLRERGTLEQSHLLIDEALSNANANREQIGKHNEIFRDMRQKMTRINSMFPNMDSLIGKIGTRQRFESFVLLGTTAFCLLVILWYKCIHGG